MNSRFRRRILFATSIFLLLASHAFAKDAGPTVVVWPESGTPVVRFTFGKLKPLAAVNGQHAYSIDTKVENLWTKKISDAAFDLYLYDKNNVRIGQGWLSVMNAAPGDVIKFQTNITASGQPVSMKVLPRSLPSELEAKGPPKKISLTVNSVPQGSHFMLDGKDGGITPKAIEVAIGTHMLEFDKEGFSHGKYPFSIGPDDVSGGNISYELGASAHDTVELRDGSIINGDLLSISATEVFVKVGGNPQTLDRNQVKRITLVQRDAESQ
jgi:hypothetical protein